MLERRLYLHIDWLLIGAITCLTVIGVAMIFSTTGSWRLPDAAVYAIVLVDRIRDLSEVRLPRAPDKSHFIYCSARTALYCWFCSRRRARP